MPEETQGTATQQTTTAPSGQTAEQQPLQTEQTQTQETQPSLDQVRQELQQEREARIRHEQSAKYYQAEFTRSRQQAQALAGIVPQEDPLAKEAKFFESRGFDPEGGKAIAEYFDQKFKPIQQRNQQLESMFQATQQTSGILEQAYQSNAALFQDPDIVREVQAGLQQVAMAGQGNLMTPQYAEQLALLAWADRNAPGRQKAVVQNQQPRLQMPSLGGFNGPSGNYQAMPVRQQGPQVDAAADAYVKQQMAAYGPKQPTK